jgi:hypothetical protein
MRNPSGRFVLRVTPRLHARLRARARRERVSLNRLCEQILECSETPRNQRAADYRADNLALATPRSRAASRLSEPEPGRTINPYDRTAVSPPPGFAQELANALTREWGNDLIGIVLFGSAARGEATAGSDIDILIVLEAGCSITRALYDRWDGMIRSRGNRTDERVSPQFVVLSSDPSQVGSLWLEVAREGIIVFDPGGRVARFLVALRDYILSGAVSRRTAHGHPYWVRVGGRR